jgi:2-oxoisovalerate dehydrogenase E1 component beta subunit
MRFRTNGDWQTPLVVRTAYGGGFRGGPYHSQSIEAYYCHVPGLRVVAASTPADAKGLLIGAIPGALSGAQAHLSSHSR